MNKKKKKYTDISVLWSDTRKTNKLTEKVRARAHTHVKLE